MKTMDTTTETPEGDMLYGYRHDNIIYGLSLGGAFLVLCVLIYIVMWYLCCDRLYRQANHQAWFTGYQRDDHLFEGGGSLREGTYRPRASSPSRVQHYTRVRFL